MLECEALRDSIRAGDDEWEARVVSAYHTLSRAEKRLAQDPAGAFEEWEARNRAFHGALISGCKSRWILQFQSILYQQSERYRRMSATTAPSIPDSVHQEHRKLYEVAIARNETAAMALLADHVHFALIAIKNTGTLK